MAPKIDWETSVGYSPQEWPEVLVSIEKPAPLRVLAALDDYYNYDFADEAGQICIRLQDPVSKELLGYGYLPRNHPAAPVLEEILEDASPRAPRPITVEVAATQKSPRTKQLKITNILADGWREHGNVILASAGLPTAVTH